MELKILFFIALTANHIFTDGKPAVSLTFDKSFYEATYTAMENNIDAIVIDGSIRISAADAQITLSGNYAYHFNVGCSADGICTLTVKDDLSEDTLSKEKEIVLGIEATDEATNERSIALVIIHLPLDNVKSAPKFSQNYYIYNYQIVDSDAHLLTEDGNPVNVIYEDKASVTIALNDYQDNFAVTYDPESDKWNFAVTKPLEPSILNENTELIIGLRDFVDNSDESTATLLIKLPVSPATNVMFDKIFYEAIYTAVQNKIDLIAVTGNIQISYKTAKVTLSGDYAHHFTIDCVTGDYCTITLTEDLPDDTLKNNKQVIIGLEASVEETNEDSVALLIVHLPLDNIHAAPKFTQDYYIYKYQVDVINNREYYSLIPDGNPVDVISDNKASVIMELSDYQNNFAFTYDSKTNQWNFAVTTGLPASENTQLIIGLKSFIDSTDERTATLIIELPVKAAVDVTFSKTFYEATYTAIPNQIDSIAVSETIEINYKEANVLLSGDYACHFNVDCSSGNCQLTIKDDLSEDILANNKEVVVGVEAFAEDPTRHGIALVIVHLPSDKAAPTFSQVYYVYEYQTDGETFSLSAKGSPLAIASDNNTGVNVILSDYQDNFVVTYNPDADQWNIDVKEPLDETTLKQNVELVLSVTAVLDDSAKSTAALLIALPEKNSVTFKKSFYRVNYTAIEGEVDVIDTDEVIVISDSKATVTLSGEYASHFDVDCSTGICQLTVQDDLSGDILAKTYDVVIQIEAFKEVVDEPIIAIVVISLPLQRQKPDFRFSRTSYTYDYLLDDEGAASLTADEDLIALVNDGGRSVSVMLSDYKENFALIYIPEENQLSISVQEPLDDDILNNKNQLIIRIFAIVEASEEICTATLLIKLPEKNSV